MNFGDISKVIQISRSSTSSSSSLSDSTGKIKDKNTKSKKIVLPFSDKTLTKTGKTLSCILFLDDLFLRYEVTKSKKKILHQI